MRAIMRIIAEIPHPECKITVFAWSGRYLVKFEQGPIEQTYKIKELDVDGEAGIKQLLKDAKFVQAAVARFGEMHLDLNTALAKLNPV